MPATVGGFFEGWPKRPSDAVLLDVLASSYRTVIALDGERMVGFISAISDGVLSAHITLLEVLSGYRGRGIGSELVVRMLKQLEEVYAVDVVCDDDVVSFYERLGLQPAAAMVLRRPDTLRSG